jgi:N-acetylmuramate 1-kinase
VSTIPSDVAQYVTQWLGPGWTARSLVGDASIRSYFRITAADGRTYMLASYPEEAREQLSRFLAAHETIAPHAPVPEVLQSCEVAVLQRDVGDRSLYDVLHEDRDEGIRLYGEAIDLLVEFQKAPDRRINRPFSPEFFFRELEMAREFYVEKLMGGDVVPIEPMLKMLCENVARHPYVLCHRDFHGQNLHIFNDAIYLIDYQDMRLGPDTYDMASLLRDRGVGRILGDDVELELLDSYERRRGGLQPGFRQRYFEILLQRSIKIIGTFSKQAIVRGRMHYLEFIPATLESIRRCLEELPEYAALRDIFPIAFDPDAALKRAQNLNRGQGAGGRAQ